ncbi:sensor histidine kinase [Autumnicola psychrophila]|uniref:histidine kinase n=1 Tax=Autumnicola psychrophila TaxID=3075592 RepID=A0ABU3DUM5_9FLAO|nr:PAS domain-containing sensor histidine kinase [Zunongwangia sp. F225]MDT0687406.1 PAS domain-containing sensor histidine kinase [Zunongwangia sp. F225]
MKIISSPPEDTAYDLAPFFELSEDYLCIAGFDGYFRSINPAFVKLLGYSEKELFSFPISELIFQPDRTKTANLREQLREGVPLLNFQNRYITKTGEIVWLTWTSIPVPSQELIYAIAKNITHIKNQEQERNTLIKNISFLNKELTKLSYTTTHDLKSPVNNLISLFSLLDTTEIKNEDNLLYMDLLKESAESLKDILNNYIDTIKETGKSLVKTEKLDINKVFQDTINPIKYLIQSTNTSFDTDFSEVKFVNFNSFYLHSIFLNLISNSIKYARPGVPPIIKITSKKIANTVHVIYNDNGLGFNMNKVEDKVFRLHETFHGHTESKGVGLYLVKDYMNTLGGTVSLKSEVDKGSTFSLVFKV